jgi:hypothetical protein
MKHILVCEEARLRDDVGSIKNVTSRALIVQESCPETFEVVSD